MIGEDIKSNENDIHDPPDTTQTSSDQFKNTQKDVTEIETIHTYTHHPIIINPSSSSPFVYVLTEATKEDGKK